MNRKQRRELQKEKGTNFPAVAKEPVYQMKKSDIEQIKAKAREEASEEAIILLFALPIKLLHDEYGWGTQKRLPEFGEKLTDEYQAFSDGTMSLKEYADLVFEYTGIKFERAKD